MGNSSSSTTRAAAITAAAAAVAATATAAWVFHSCFSSETVEPQNRSSATKESQNKSPKTEELQSRSLETTEDLDFPIYYPETKASLSGETFVYYQANEVHVDQRIIHHTRHTQLDHVQESKVKGVGHHFESKESCKQNEEVHHQNSRRSKAKQKLKADANKQIPKHLTPNSYNHIKNSERHSKIQIDKSCEDAGVQADSSQIGGKKVIPRSLKKHRRQKNKQSDNQEPQKLRRKRKLKVDGNNQISRHLTPEIRLQDTIKIMSYNIWSIKSYKRERRMNAVSHLIEQHSPDIILLQEVTPEVYIYFQSCNWWNVYKCSIKDKQATKQVKATKQVFCMMLSKLPVKKFVNKQFVNTKTCKGVSLARFTSNPKKALTVATCHLKSMNGVCTNTVQRTSQAKEAIDLLKFSPNVVLGGDMNWDESTDGPFPLTSGWCDAWSDLKPEEDGYTYDTQSNAMLRGRRFVRKRLDRFVCRLKDFDMIDIEIFGTEAIKGVSCKRSGEKLPLLPSDHYGLILTICAK